MANAPRLWCIEVTTRLLKLGYTQHSFDKMVFMKRDSSGALISIIVVYVDDFWGAFRVDYDVSEVHKTFTWGSLSYFELDKPLTFKGKELTLRLTEQSRETRLVHLPGRVHSRTR